MNSYKLPHKYYCGVDLHSRACTFASSARRAGWAFSEAAVLFVAKSEQGRTVLKRLERKYGKPKALSVLATSSVEPSTTRSPANRRSTRSASPRRNQVVTEQRGEAFA